MQFCLGSRFSLIRPAKDKAHIALGQCGPEDRGHVGRARHVPRGNQPNTRKRSASSMKALSPKPASFEPNGICARSFQ